MPRPLKFLIAGGVLLVVACVLPCWMLLQHVDIPYQDPTPEMLQEQAARHRAADRAWLTWIPIGIVLTVAGLVVCGYGLFTGRRGSGDANQVADNDGPQP